MPSKPVVLFVCSHNSARSQMAEGWLRHLAGDRYDARSAGVDPGTLNPLAVRAMDEVGIDISGHRAEGVRQYLGHVPVAYLVIVCDKAARSCPRVWPGVRDRFFWPFDDPAAVEGTAEQKLEAFRQIRDEIRSAISAWLDRDAQAPTARRS
jgi:arsenate reductase